MKRILGLEHRANGIYGYQEENGDYIAILRAPKGELSNVEIMWDDPYNWTKKNENGEHVWACTQVTKSFMKETDGIYDFYNFRLSSREKRFKYFFAFDYKEKRVAYGEFGTQEFKDLDDYNYHGFSFTWNYSSIGKYVSPPKWWTRTNWYQVFPDRFNKGGGELSSEFDNHMKMAGGNIKGIIEKLDYIKDLGFNGIYLNPIFKATSAHKYNTIDYKEIDPDFGTLEDFRTMVKEVHKRGMKIMLDGVFNHIGSFHPLWQDVLKNGKDSKYADWFTVWHWDNLKNADDYGKEFFGKTKAFSTFADTPTMPRLKWDNPEVTEFVLDIIAFWTNEGIDAWRMDVADEVSFDMWRKVRIKAREINEEIAILGEVWYDSQLFLNGDQFDSSMNYPFRLNVLKLFATKEIDIQEFIDRTIQNKYVYSREISKGLFNLVGSHDTPRFSTMTKGDHLSTRLGIALLLLFPGVISWYYGDENDLDFNGSNERGLFNWNFDEKNNTRQMVKELMKYRNENIDSINEYPTFANDDNSIIINYSNGHKAFVNIKNGEIKINDNGKEVLSFKVEDK